MTVTAIAAAIAAEGMARVLPGPVPVTLLHGIDFAAARGEFVAITGASGSGKSSLLYVLGLLDTPTSGRVLIDGEDASRLPPEEQARLRLMKLGFVFQFHFLLPEFTALMNVMIPMKKKGGRGEGDMRARAAELLGAMGLSAHLSKRPDQLSGGERQRVAIARALANDPAIILADEPTGNLDSASAQRVFAILSALAHDEGRTVIVVTHDPVLADLTDRQVHLVDGGIVG
ncbi:MAG: ABC transporter ATP-binding protein [Alphaproteobacteria bacterium]